MRNPLRSQPLPCDAKQRRVRTRLVLPRLAAPRRALTRLVSQVVFPPWCAPFDAQSAGNTPCLALPRLDPTRLAQPCHEKSRPDSTRRSSPNA